MLCSKIGLKIKGDSLIYIANPCFLSNKQGVQYKFNSLKSHELVTFNRTTGLGVNKEEGVKGIILRPQTQRVFFLSPTCLPLLNRADRSAQPVFI